MIPLIRKIEPQKFIPVDSWKPSEADRIFKATKGSIQLPVSEFYGVKNDALNIFVLSPKKCYNGD